MTPEEAFTLIRSHFPPMVSKEVAQAMRVLSKKVYGKRERRNIDWPYMYGRRAEDRRST